MVWPQMPYDAVSRWYLPGIPGIQIDTVSRKRTSLWTQLWQLWNTLCAIPATIYDDESTRAMRRKMGMNYALPDISKPNHLILVNSFWGLETPKEVPPLIASVGPILPEWYPSLDDDSSIFFHVHKRVVYLSFGTHTLMAPKQLEALLRALISLGRQRLIDRVLWAATDSQLKEFPQNLEVGGLTIDISWLTANKQMDWRFTNISNQRAVLATPKTALFITHGGDGSINEAFLDGEAPLLVMDVPFDAPSIGTRVERAGVGLQIDTTSDASFSEEEITEKCRALLTDEDDKFATNLKKMKRMAQLGAKGKEFTADLIEEMMVDWKLGHERPAHLQMANTGKPIYEGTRRLYELPAIVYYPAGAFAFGALFGALASQLRSLV
ncbi:hypothetical protein B0T16DRAFT_397400 [Cercophora newfieldiana]|uniref:Uncharacterized protein n=1 Tax=Cercophora newfieldiana TaxID=92897 RepID=A0AA39YN78_9PEZI|nr:hypothetical protein B0T16DRAFT_397400 [Cercophora newfieldiana]